MAEQLSARHRVLSRGVTCCAGTSFLPAAHNSQELLDPTLEKARVVVPTFPSDAATRSGAHRGVTSQLPALRTD